MTFFWGFFWGVVAVAWFLFSKDRIQELKRLRLDCYILSFECIQNIESAKYFLADYRHKIYNLKDEPKKFSGKTKKFFEDFCWDADNLKALVYTTREYLKLAGDYWDKGGFFNLTGSFLAFEYYLKARIVSRMLKERRDQLTTPWLKFCSLLKFPPTKEELVHIGRKDLEEAIPTDPISCSDEIMTFVNQEIARQQLLVAATTGLSAALLSDVLPQPEATVSTEVTTSMTTETSTNDFYTSGSDGFVSGCGGCEVQ